MPPYSGGEPPDPPAGRKVGEDLKVYATARWHLIMMLSQEKKVCRSCFSQVFHVEHFFVSHRSFKLYFCFFGMQENKYIHRSFCLAFQKNKSFKNTRGGGAGKAGGQGRAGQGRRGAGQGRAWLPPRLPPPSPQPPPCLKR